MFIFIDKNGDPKDPPTLSGYRSKAVFSLVMLAGLACSAAEVSSVTVKLCKAAYPQVHTVETHAILELVCHVFEENELICAEVLLLS